MLRHLTPRLHANHCSNILHNRLFYAGLVNSQRLLIRHRVTFFQLPIEQLRVRTGCLLFAEAYPRLHLEG